jgi:hypothetical protein
VSGRRPARATAALAGVLTLGWLTGCGGGADDAAAEETEASQPPKTVFDPMTSPLDEAREAAETLPQARKEGLDQAIDTESR